MRGMERQRHETRGIHFNTILKCSLARSFAVAFTPTNSLIFPRSPDHKLISLSLLFRTKDFNVRRFAHTYCLSLLLRPNTHTFSFHREKKLCSDANRIASRATGRLNSIRRIRVQINFTHKKNKTSFHFSNNWERTSGFLMQSKTKEMTCLHSQRTQCTSERERSLYLCKIERLALT